MKITLSSIEAIFGTLNKIATQTPVGANAAIIGFRVAKTIKIVQTDYDAIISARKKIDETYKDKIRKDGNGEPIVDERGAAMLLPQFIEPRLNEIYSLMDSETDVDYPTIKYSDIASNFNLTPQDYVALMPILEDDSEEFFAKLEAMDDNPDHNTKTE